MKEKKAATLACAVLTVMVVFTVAIAVIPALAQNAVPPTAREAAAIPAFASRLHTQASQAAGKSPASNHYRTGIPWPQYGVIYSNGPVNGTVDAWTINFGYVVSDSFPGGTVNGFDIWVWEFPGDVMTSVDWSITSDPNSGTVHGSGTASGNNLTDQFISTNQFGYNIDKISVSGLNVSAGGYLNLQNAVVPSGDPVYWDENSGPSQAYESSVGTIPSESFDITGSSPECVYDMPQDGFKIIHSFTETEQSPAAGLAIDQGGSSTEPRARAATTARAWVISWRLAARTGSSILCTALQEVTTGKTLPHLSLARTELFTVPRWADSNLTTGWFIA